MEQLQRAETDAAAARCIVSKVCMNVAENCEALEAPAEELTAIRDDIIFKSKGSCFQQRVALRKKVYGGFWQQSVEEAANPWGLATALSAHTVFKKSKAEGTFRQERTLETTKTRMIRSDSEGSRSLDSEEDEVFNIAGRKIRLRVS